MTMKLLIQHGSNLYDATPLLAEEVEWYASILGKAGRLRFRVVRDGITHFTEGDRVSFYVEGVLRFSGFVMTKERTEEQIISVTAYDQMFYLARNRGTYLFRQKGAGDILRQIAGEYGLKVGKISDSGWKIPQRIEEGETLLDILLSALQICGQAVGKEYFLFDRAGYLTIQERQEMKREVALRCDGGIAGYHYETDISRDTYNAVRLYHAGRKETERSAWSGERQDKVEKWGRLQYYKRVPYAMTGAELQVLGKELLRKKCRVEKQLQIENLNGDELLFAGNSIWLEIPDLAEISLQGMALIESCTHFFQDGAHRTKLDIRIEEE